MNRVPRPVLVVAVLAILAVVALMLFRKGEATDNWLGYVEGETLYIGAPQAGRLASRPVERGSRVATGAPLFSLDTTIAEAETGRVEAEAAQARAQAVACAC